jgi:serine phosphatase RsbU (regulator of sigma subunit)/anti-sigma regulatory factor (Ser/Thr protein kinase)
VRLGLRLKLLVAGLLVLAVTAMVGALIVNSASNRLQEKAFSELHVSRESKATQIEAEIGQFLANLDTLAHSRAAVTGLPALDAAFRELGDPVDQEALDEYYDQQFVPRVAGPAPLSQVIARNLQPDVLHGRKAQDVFIANNPFPVGSKDELIRPSGHFSPYALLHEKLHPFFHSALDSFGAYDIFLIDHDGDIVYSVFKEVDFGTNLDTGGHANSGLGDVWHRSQLADEGEVVVSDFAQYVPSYNQPAAFAAQGVYDDFGNRIGTIAMQAPIDRINDVMTSGERWAEVGLGESGETYIVAADGTMRNDSRFLIDDRTGYFKAIVESGLPLAMTSLIDTFDTTVGLQPVDTEGTRDALAGNSDERIFPDYRGVDVLSSYAPLDLGDTGLDWVIMSEIDAAEAFADRDHLRETALFWFTLTAVVMIAAIVFGTGRITRPIKLLDQETTRIAGFDFAGDYDSSTLDRISARRDELGDLAESFADMTATLGENINARQAVESELDVASGIQRSMLPLTFPTRPEFTEFELYADLVPAKEVGGDFYDFGSIDSDRFFFVVGDVSGKGVPAALFMAASKTLIRSGALAGEPPDQLLTRINAEIAESNPEFMFATVWLGVLDLRTGRVTFTNAGHNPPLLITADGAEFVKDRHGPFVGPVPGSAYGSGELTLAPGDRLVVYSDGVTEAMNPDEDLFGEDRLTIEAERSTELNVEDATTALIQRTLRWEKGDRSDDVTVLMIEFVATRDVPQLKVTLDPSLMLAEAGRLNAGVAAFAREQNVPGDIVSKLQIALDEILTNVAMHSDADVVTVDIWLSDTMLRTTITDNGSPFNPLKVPPPDTTLGLHERDVGGLGLHLVRGLMQTVDYRYMNGRNVLAMTQTT